MLGLHRAGTAMAELQPLPGPDMGAAEMQGLSLPDLGMWKVELRASPFSNSTAACSHCSLLPAYLSPFPCLVLQLPQPLRRWAAVSALWRFSWFSAQRQPLRQESAQLHPLLAQVSPGHRRAGGGEGRALCMPEARPVSAGR